MTLTREHADKRPGNSRTGPPDALRKGGLERKNPDEKEAIDMKPHASFNMDCPTQILRTSLEITCEKVAVLTDMAAAVENIDEAKAEEARQLAAARLRETLSAQEVASVNASLARTLAQMQVKRRRRT